MEFGFRKPGLMFKILRIILIQGVLPWLCQWVDIREQGWAARVFIIVG